MMKKDNICALVTASGLGAIAVIRVSGPDAIALCTPLFKSVKEGKSLLNQKTHTIHLGTIMDGTQLVDEVLVSIFKGPNSYTGENIVEISLQLSKCQYFIAEEPPSLEQWGHVIFGWGIPF